jgi:hypothetical protein
VNDAQTWTIIGGFLAVMVGMSGLLRRVVGAEIRGLRGEMTAEIGWLRGGMKARFDAVDVRFDGVHRRLHGLDQDVQALTRRVFGVDDGR